jgi:hypothetical protein
MVKKVLLVNSSSIIFAFFIAGLLTVTVHDVFFGPIAYGPNNALHQIAKKHTESSKKVHAIAFKEPMVNQ